MIRTLYFICIIFVKNIIIYWLILTVNHQGSYFPFFCLHPVGQTFLYPSKLCNHLKHSAKLYKKYLYTTNLYTNIQQDQKAKLDYHMSMLFAYMAGGEGDGG